MRRLLVVLGALLLVAVPAGCSSDEDATSDDPTTTVAADDNAAADDVTDSTSAAVANAVTTEGTSFSPKELTVKVGDTVTFTNSGGSHSVSPDAAKGWNEGGASVADWSEPGSEYQTTFTDAGTYAYHCQIHGAAGGSGMSGVVVVE